MPTADQVKALVRSHAAGDDARFYSVALQVAARAARSGQGRFAQELKNLIDEAQASGLHGVQRPTPVAQPRGELEGLLSLTYPTTTLDDLVLEQHVLSQLQRVVLEQLQQETLKARGFRPLRRLLLVGPPGTGKTMSAGALAGELHLPLFVIRLDGLITKYMGETAAKLRLIFDALAQTRGIYLFDEVDALGGERARGNDVGEIRRVLNSFLQFLEFDDSPSLLIAATNHPQLLDRAIFRRFDSAIEYPLPTSTIAKRVITTRLANFSVGRIDWPRVLKASKGLSHSELTLAAETAAKDAILEHRTAVSTSALVNALVARSREQADPARPSIGV
jgi:SpoVK/Ycf46/Vps4 family AAA+-type ATPase